jgi:16S rRNA (adenine1518-N6/adenine1519-N6)-dimethyltransferase
VLKKSRRKALGQHFLRSRSVLKMILRTINPQPDDLIIEIGSGKGILTLPLAKKAGKVIAIEKDRSLIPALRRKDIPHLLILEKDVLKVDFQQLLKEEKGPCTRVKLVGNLPYSISSPLLFNILHERGFFSECVFLLQKEVAQRVSAEPGSKKFAPLSIIFQLYFSARIQAIIPPQAFSPPPRVESALISLQRRKVPLFPLENDSFFLEFLKGTFRHRRKTLRNNLQRLSIPSSLIEDAFQDLSIKKDARPEQLTISQWVNLFEILHPEST